jgi:NAD+ synthase (glutamine-hydrolysing)
MKLVRVGAAVVNQTPLDWKGNQANIVACIREARERGVSILCLPELCITGYGCEDAFHSRGIQETALRVLEEIIPSTQGIVVSVGLPVLHRNAVFNAACLVADGKVLGLVTKRYLAGDGIHYEPRWFKPWPVGKRATFEMGSSSVPIGDLYFDVGGIKIGFEICEDAWVARRPGADLAAKGVDVILNPSASHFALGKQTIRERLVVEGSRAFGVTYLYANLLGNEGGRVIYDGGAIIASGGNVMARGSRLSFAAHELTTAIVDIDAMRMSQARSASFEPDVAESDASSVRAGFRYPSLEPAHQEATRRTWESGPDLKEEELTRAIALGLFDYLRKCRSNGFVVSLSGGCDSSAVAALCALMVQLAAAELGAEGFVAKLAHVQGLDGARDARALVGRLLTCVYQATRNSSPVTRDAARSLADALGAQFLELDVDRFVEGYTSLVGEALGRAPSWSSDDLALQNIQARARGPGVWMIANLKNALLLATSNRSEAAVGYATMDGDTCGGLSPIAGIDKAFLLHHLGWLEKRGPEGVGPIAALAKVTRQLPTAELRPADRGQTDEDDLMPYDVLDAIERAAIRDKMVPLEVYKQVRATFPDRACEQLALWVDRFFRLWCRNQWKRERYAPSFHLDDENLDPKSWCRFPILSSGFAQELEELRDYVKSS